MPEGNTVKGDEKHPLLMVDAGSGDGGGRASPKNLSSIHPMWNVTSYAPRRSWVRRWPEWLSSCWMTLVLVGITFTVFYAIGMVALKRDRFVLNVKCKENKTNNNVFMHHMVPRSSSSLYFTNFADLLSNMATTYPLLNFNVIFLIDDTPCSSYGFGFRHPSRFMVPRMPRINPLALNPLENIELKAFEAQHSNVKINVIFMSKFMAMTPLKHKWSTVPKSILTFYARIFSVWQNSGIGIDLAAYNNQRRSYMHDWRLESILKERNDGMRTKIIQTPNPVTSRQENSQGQHNLVQHKENEYLNEVYDIFQKFQQILVSSSYALFNANATTAKATNITADATDIDQQNESILRTKRNKLADKAIFDSNPYTVDENNVILDLIPEDKLFFIPPIVANTKIDTIAAETVEKKIDVVPAYTVDKKNYVVPVVNVDKKMDVPPASPVDRIMDIIPGVTVDNNIDVITIDIDDKRINSTAATDDKIELAPAVIGDKKIDTKGTVLVNNMIEAAKTKKKLEPKVTHEKRDNYKINNVLTVNKSPKTLMPMHFINSSTPDSAANKSDVQENLIILYDISLVIGPAAPPPPKYPLNKTEAGVVNIDAFGSFVSASSHYHPFLYQILMNAGCKKLIPRIAIFDALMTQCSRDLSYDSYCTDIHLL